MNVRSVRNPDTCPADFMQPVPDTWTVPPEGPKAHHEFSRENRDLPREIPKKAVAGTQRETGISRKFTDLARTLLRIPLQAPSICPGEPVTDGHGHGGLGKGWFGETHFQRISRPVPFPECPAH